MRQIFLAIALISYINVDAQNVKTVPALPGQIKFERQVIQQNNGEDGVATSTYYFTTDGSYAMMKRQEPGDDDKATILYTKDGQTCMIDEAKKTIVIMNMPKVVAVGGEASKEIAEKISKKPLKKDDKEKITSTPTGKTKTICGFTSYEYEVKSEGGKSSWWYAKVDFDPILVYTMGIGKMGDMSKVKNDPAMKMNPAAIPIINKNYFMAEIEVAGKKGLETKSITKTTFIFSTAGYTIKDMSKMGLKEIIKANH